MSNGEMQCTHWKSSMQKCEGTIEFKMMKGINLLVLKFKMQTSFCDGALCNKRRDATAPSPTLSHHSHSM